MRVWHRPHRLSSWYSASRESKWEAMSLDNQKVRGDVALVCISVGDLGTRLVIWGHFIFAAPGYSGQEMGATPSKMSSHAAYLCGVAALGRCVSAVAAVTPESHGIVLCHFGGGRGKASWP